MSRNAVALGRLPRETRGRSSFRWSKLLTLMEHHDARTRLGNIS